METLCNMLAYVGIMLIFFGALIGGCVITASIMDDK